MKVKICGITSHDDARLALDLGAWALGFIFHRPSPRFIEPAVVGDLLRRLPSDVLGIGVFVDWPLDDLQAAVIESGIRGVQLHGSEDPEYARTVAEEILPGGIVIKAFRVGPHFRTSDVHRYPGARILLDAYQPGVPGGTGAVFDWKIARDIARGVPILLAGGIGPENVAAAIQDVAPAGVDVSSGGETSPGVKDPAKLRELFDTIRRLSPRP